MNTTENNKLIAEFLNCKQDGNGQYLIPNWGWDKVENLKFDSDWNWLMEVVEKIETMGFIVDLKGTNGKITHRKNKDVEIIELGENRIAGAYNVCLSFVKWYNFLKQK